MAYNVKFANQDLSKFCTILNVQRSLLPPRTNYSKSIPTMNGSFYTGFHYGEREITLEVLIQYDNVISYTEKIRKLASVLDVKNPSKLYISDMPGKFYYAVIDGDTELDKAVGGGTFKIKFICHDPLIYSENWSTFQESSKGILTIDNAGTADAKMIVDVDFNNDACFFQMTNKKGETVLIGQPKKTTQNTINVSDIVVDDPCTSADAFISLPQSIIDNDRTVTGVHTIRDGGNGITCSNFGTAVDDTWTGTSFRKSLGKNVDEFEVSVDFIFSSQGQNYIAPEPAPPVLPPTPQPTTPPATSLGTYKVVNCGGLWINQDPNTSRPIYAMGPGMYVYPVEVSGNWVKHTHTNIWNHTFTGWTSLKYLEKISDGHVGINSPLTNREVNIDTSLVDDIQSFSMNTKATEWADDEIGMMEIYGFDQNGKKLFKLEVSDTNEYYEYVDPVLYIGNTKVLDDGKNCPSPRQVTVKENDEDVTKSDVSGMFGDWNDLNGKIVVKREKNSKGVYLWSAALYKYQDGKIIKTIMTSNSLTNSNFPTGQLNYLGFYIGRYGNHDVVDVMTITNVKVKTLNISPDEYLLDNQAIFSKGDHLQIDFESGKVTKDGQEFLTHIDIGSEFFDVPSGISEIAVRTDDNNAAICCGIQERFI